MWNDMKNIKQKTISNDINEPIKSSLISRNVTIFGRRTSVRLEPDMWIALKDISNREECSVHEVCALVSIRKGRTTSLTAAIRVFIMLYFRSAATESGHISAGHGDFSNMKRRANIPQEYMQYFQNKDRK